MAIRMYWADPGEKQEIVEFIDYVFSKAHRPHDFETLLPKLYGAQGDGAAHHFVIREDGRIMATILAYPVDLRIGETTLRTLGIGSVSTHPAARGRGYMQALLSAVDERAKEMDAAFAVLGGDRQRYQYFGYDYGGYQMNAQIEEHNVRHALRDVDVSGLEVVEMTQAHTPQAMTLQRRMPCYCLRSEGAYLDALRSWNNRPFAVMRGGQAIGFGTLRQNPGSTHIAELLLEEEGDFASVIKRLSSLHGRLTMAAAPWETQRAHFLSAMCEGFSVRPNYQYKFYQTERVREALAPLGLAGNGLGFDGFSLPLPLYIAPPDAV